MGEKVVKVRMCINERAGMEKYDQSNCDRQHKVYKDAACEHCPQYREVEQQQQVPICDEDREDENELESETEKDGEEIYRC